MRGSGDKGVTFLTEQVSIFALFRDCNDEYMSVFRNLNIERSDIASP